MRKKKTTTKKTSNFLRRNKPTKLTATSIPSELTEPVLANTPAESKVLQVGMRYHLVDHDTRAHWFYYDIEAICHTILKQKLKNFCVNNEEIPETIY